MVHDDDACCPPSPPPRPVRVRMCVPAPHAPRRAICLFPLKPPMMQEQVTRGVKVSPGQPASREIRAGRAGRCEQSCFPKELCFEPPPLSPAGLPLVLCRGTHTTPHTARPRCAPPACTRRSRARPASTCSRTASASHCCPRSSSPRTGRPRRARRTRCSRRSSCPGVRGVRAWGGVRPAGNVPAVQYCRHCGTIPQHT